MARREYEMAKGIDGLVFYAPLSTEGDLSDHISGNLPTIPTSTNVSWDADWQGYRIRPKTYASSQGGNRYNSGIIYTFDSSQFVKPNQKAELTVFYEFVQYKTVNYSTNTRMAMCQVVKTDSNSSILTAPNANWPNNIARELNTPMNIGTSISVDFTQLRYSNHYFLNGENELTASGSTSLASMPNQLRLFVGNQEDGRSSYYTDAVFKNVMIFNRILSQSEIQQLIQILRL